MLPPHYRMRRSREFVAATRRGRRAGSRYVSGFLTQQTDAEARRHSTSGGPCRVGLAVGRPVGNAVRRNLVRRRLRQLLRDRLCALPSGGLLVIRARPTASGATNAELAAALDRVLSRLGVGAAAVEERG